MVFIINNMSFFIFFIDLPLYFYYNITMKTKTVKSKNRRFAFESGTIDIIDWGYNDFKYVQPITTPRVINHYSLHFVVKGSGTLNYGKNTHKITEKSVFCLQPGVLLSYYPESKEPWRYYWINFTGSEASQLLTQMGFTVESPVKKATLLETVYASLENLLNSNCSQKEFYFRIKSVLYDAVSRLCDDKNAETFIKNSNLVSRVKEILLINYENPSFSVEVLADILHVSHSYVCRLFKEETGQTVVKYLVNLRLEKAAELLNQKNYLIKDLAYKVGFNDELHFMKEFKRKYGVTVKNYYKNLF